MDILHELLIIVIVGGLVSVGAYDALKCFIKYLLQKRKDDKLELGPIDEHIDNKDDVIEEIKDDVNEIVDDTENIIDDTTHGILKPVLGTVKLAGKVIKKAVKLITFWRK